jgi:hypothetical protein
VFNGRASSDEEVGLAVHVVVKTPISMLCVRLPIASLETFYKL